MMLKPKTCRLLEEVFVALFAFFIVEVWVFFSTFVLHRLSAFSSRAVALFLLLILLSNILAKVAQMYITALSRVWKQDDTI